MTKVRQHPWLLYIFAGFAYVFLYAPIVHVVINSFNANRDMVKWGGATLDWYRQVWSNETVLEGAWNSLIIAILVTALAVMIGTSIAVSGQRLTHRARSLLDALTYTRIIMPELVLAIALLIFLNAIGVPRGILGVVIGHSVWTSAYVTVVVKARLAGRDPSLDEAARDLGATRWRAFWRVTLPDLMPAVAASALLVFAFSFENVVTSFFLSGDKNTLPTVILSLIRYEVNPGVNAIGTVLVGITLFVLIPYLISEWRNLVHRPNA